MPTINEIYLPEQTLAIFMKHSDGTVVKYKSRARMDASDAQAIETPFKVLNQFESQKEAHERCTYAMCYIGRGGSVVWFNPKGHAASGEAYF